MNAIVGPSPANSPSDALTSADDVDAAIEVREVLAGLPNDRRSILLLNETEGWTIAEIAAMIKMRPGTVGRKLAEAKEMFRQQITARLVPRAKGFPPDPD